MVRPGVGGMVGLPPYQGAGGGPNGSVMMVYGVDAKRHNTDSVFNIMCLYGNVMRVSIICGSILLVTLTKTNIAKSIS